MKAGYYGIMVAWFLDLVALMRSIVIMDLGLTIACFLSLLVITISIIIFIEYEFTQNRKKVSK